jgi:acetyl-CoA synthetase
MLNRFLPRVDFKSYDDFLANYSLNIPESFNFGFDVVDAWAEEQADKRALVWCNDHGDERAITFGEMSKLSSQAAHFFAGQGIKKGDVVMLILRQRWEYWPAAVGLHKLGAVLIPGSLLLTEKDIVYRAKAANIQYIVCVDDAFAVASVEAAMLHTDVIQGRAIVGGPKEGWVDFWAGVEAQPSRFDRPDIKNTDTMLIYFTSGTTGMPKMVAHNFTHPLGHIITAKYWQQVREDKLHMSVADTGWAKFGWGKIYGQWICGAVVFAYDYVGKFEPRKQLEVLERYKVATFCAPPTNFRFMLQEDLTQYDLSSIVHCGNAGEPLNPEVFERWKEYTGQSLCEGFGQSESSVLIANFPWFEPRPGSMGKPAPLYNIQLLDADGNPCEAGEEGEIFVTGLDKGWPAGLFVGYYQDEDLTANAFANGRYGTGDMAWRDDDGYYWFVGRNDDMIKCSGYRIGPFEVESALMEHPAVLESAVTGTPDPIRGQVVKATVVLKAGYRGSPALVKELQDHVKKVTAPYKYPRVIEFVGALPKTLGGAKIKRAEIRKLENQPKPPVDAALAALKRNLAELYRTVSELEELHGHTEPWLVELRKLMEMQNLM